MAIGAEKLVRTLVIVVTIIAPDGSRHEHASTPFGRKLDTVADDLEAKWGSELDVVACGKIEYRMLPQVAPLTTLKSFPEVKSAKGQVA